VKRRVFLLFFVSSLLLSGCNQGRTAEEIADYYAKKAAEKAIEKTKENVSDEIEKIDQAINENEHAKKIKDGVTTTGEYAQDAYDYACDENTSKGAKEKVKKAGADYKNFLDYMLAKLKSDWKQLVEDINKGGAGATGEATDPLDNLEDYSKYDFYGDYTNPFEEAKGIDTSANGTAVDQLKDAYKEYSEETKEIIKKIKQNHDIKHPKSDDTSENYEKVLRSIQGNGNYAEIISKFIYPTIPEYNGKPYFIVNNNIPFFSEDDKTTVPFEIYSELDSLGRCGVAYANICQEIMPTEKRESIGNVKPSGFIQKRYDCLKTESNPYGYLFARCHLIAYMLAGENANEKNLITGTFYMNIDGMEPFECYVANHVKEYGGHVLYRVTPIFKDNNKVASGVLIEAKSVENNEISFCVYCYNIAPSIEIDYSTGTSCMVE